MTVLVQLWLSSSCAARWGRLNDAKRVDLVATQQRRVANATDPVERTQTYIRISQLLIDLIDSAAHEGDLDVMGPLLDQYAGAIQSARDTIVNSDRDPARDPDGFTDLELILREHARRLQDIGQTLTFDKRQPINRALGTTVSIRKELLQLIFPQTKLHLLPKYCLS